ncbi:MAG: NAD(P)H-dependent oxidoreductase subunit E [Spirochaetaceae bacterium]|nr:MAG: NAD(P)H-dependent oxidoreductase subunit E [Spirochaetaceae bacterium]
MDNRTAVRTKTDISEHLGAIDEFLAGAEVADGGLIPVLQKTQTLLGYLPSEALEYIAKKLGLPYSEVAGVATFYSFFSMNPRGKHTVRVCLGTACYVRGGTAVLEALKKELAIDRGETTEDRAFTLEVGRCFGACGLAPVLLVDDDVHQRVKPSGIKELAARYRERLEETS